MLGVGDEGFFFRDYRGILFPTLNAKPKIFIESNM